MTRRGVLLSTCWRCSEGAAKILLLSVFRLLQGLNHNNFPTNLGVTDSKKKITAAKYCFITLCPDLPACLFERFAARTGC